MFNMTNNDSNLFKCNVWMLDFPLQAHIISPNEYLMLLNSPTKILLRKFNNNCDSVKTISFEPKFWILNPDPNKPEYSSFVVD